MSGMQQNGLAKLVEECGEVIQIAGKMIQYPELQGNWDVPHPDGTILLAELEREIADLRASIEFVTLSLGLSYERIYQRERQKVARYQQWARDNA